MTEHERDPEVAKQVSQRYRELGAEKPPRALDAAILAAAHREVGGRPAPLVSPGARRRWYLPLAAAAVIVLSVAVTMHMQQEQPDLEAPAPLAKQTASAIQPAPAPQPTPQFSQAPAETQAPRTAAEAARRGIVAPAAKEEVAREDKRFTPDPRAADREEVAAATAPAAPASAPPRPEAPSLAVAPAGVGKPAALPAMPAERQLAREAADMAVKPDGNVGAVAGEAAPAARSDAREELQRRELTPKMRAVEARDKLAQEPETPEKWLERIATLRAEGRHEEADKALADFKQRYPDYRIPEAMLQKVQRPR
jgi:hypothetical protein